MKKLEKIYEGKAKILYTTEDPALLIQYFKDDATAFNAQKRGTIAEKGIMNNRIATKIFEYLQSQGIETHFVESLNDREMLVKRVTHRSPGGHCPQPRGRFFVPLAGVGRRDGFGLSRRWNSVTRMMPWAIRRSMNTISVL